MSSEAELLTALITAPQSVEAHLVLADWLTSQGDLHGELIACMCALENLSDAGKFVELKRRRDQLITQLSDALNLAQQNASVTWKRGFVESLTALNALPASVDALRTFLLCRELRFGGPARVLNEGLAQLRSRPFGLLDSLLLETANEVLPVETVWLDDALAMPLLQKLVLSSGSFGAKAANFRRLRALELHSVNLVPEVFSLWKQGFGPSLQALTWKGNTVAPEVVFEPLKALPALKSLTVSAQPTQRTVEMLCASPLLKQLDALVVHGDFKGEVLEPISTHYARFSRIRTLRFVGKPGDRALTRNLYKLLPQIKLTSA